MRELLVATQNKGKLKEIELILKGVVDRVLSLADFPDIPDVEEDGESFEENALKKAKTAAAFTGIPSMADDSGLTVDILDGRPGIFSARFAGEGASDADNNAKLLGLLSGVPQEARTAAFQCVIALCLPGGWCQTFDGEVQGVLMDAPRGEGGFGYDPLFFVPVFGRTMSELPPEIKNEFSHRGHAMAKLKEYLRNHM